MVVGVFEDEGDAKVPQVVRPILAVCVEDGCSDVEGVGGCG